MKHIKLLSFPLIILLLACSTVPLTKRKQLNLVSDQQVLASSLQQYRQFIAKAPISKNEVQTQRVRRIGTRIAHAAEQYLKSTGLGSEIKNYRWEFNLVASNQANAFCMPGGKIVVYEGILKYAQTDDELATVMSHEVSHALAKHANERMSQAMASQLGGVILGQVLSKKSYQVQAAAGIVYGLGSQMLVILPYSRKHEYEADRIGLSLMSIAGYNPRSAVNFWKHMAAGKSGKGNAEFLSTHPTDVNRIRAIEEHLPEALKYYKNGSSSDNVSNHRSKNKESKRRLREVIVN